MKAKWVSVIDGSTHAMLVPGGMLVSSIYEGRESLVYVPCPPGIEDFSGWIAQNAQKPGGTN